MPQIRRILSANSSLCAATDLKKSNKGSQLAQSNIILNGTFTNTSANWSGTDIETTYTESAYLGNGSSNRVAEIDGQSGQTTVMQQSFVVGSSHATTLTFNTALRTASNGNAGIEGFRVDILSASGTVIATQTYFPTTNVMTGVTLPVTFPAGGTYTLRFTELGPNDSLGAIVDNISVLICFTAGTRIETPYGARPIETLAVGEQVWTLDRGPMPVRWINSRTIRAAELRDDPTLRPVIFAPGSLGAGLPIRRLAVSPQHRMCIRSWRAELYFGEPEVLIPAHRLQNGTTITRAAPDADVTYVHFLLDGHQIVRANGALSESFFPSHSALGGVELAARRELARLFPDLARFRSTYAHTARIVVQSQQASLLV